MRRGRPRGLAMIAAGWLFAGPSLVACEDDPAPVTTSPEAGAANDGATASDASAARDPSANCVKPGTPNNEQGLGGYCESNADCVTGKSLCTGVFGAPPDAWFCTRPCADEPDCGAGLYCADDPRGVACVPIACGVTDASVGSDAGR